MQTSCDKSIFLWMPNEANTTLKNSGSKESCHQPCAVVRFEGPRAEGCAAKFVKEFEEKKDELRDLKCHPLKNAKVEHLGEGYEALECGKTHQLIDLCG
jgi:hypothetical protein